jgi:crossover junction endodeoxyribonuclease RuvC
VATLRVLGVDPGSVRTGYGIIERDGTRLRLVTAGTLKAGEKTPLEERLLIIHAGLTALIEEYAPNAAAVEDIFMAKFPNAALKLGHARGVALLAIAQAGLAVHPYPPAVVKRSIVGKGAADKQQVARIVGVMLGLTELPGVDATDALAIALTHAQAARMHAALAPAAKPARRVGPRGPLKARAATKPGPKTGR